ncbi:MAG: hypothetical protein L0Y35_07410 [Flammeovirgaceae bacterium]|nr:hypothetical protein [Flammeovirgaceae bacterium]
MKKFLSMIAIAALVTNFLACSDDPAPADPEAPTATAPSNVTSLVANDEATITFEISTPAGFKSAEVTATAGSAVIAEEPTVGATTGDVVVTFTSGAVNTAGSVTLTVTDNNNREAAAIAIVDVTDEIEISDNITANTTWRTGNTYVLAGRIAVVDGVTLTIEPGVVVKGQAGTTVNASALIIARGAKIMAEGTANQPIIFTSVADQIEPGELESPNLLPSVNSLWGGLLILGKAPISVSTNEDEFQIEGIPADDENGLYGGTNAADNSGVLRYISIRHGGADIGEGNEINGLTLGGVGSGTVVENIEVVANFDDGIEIFGGAVNVSDVLVWNAGDDGVDTDQAWTGTLDNFIVIAGTTTDHALEIDGPEGALGDDNGNASSTLVNGSIKGYIDASGGGTELGDFRDGARGSYENIFFFNFPDPTLGAGRGDLSLSNNSGNASEPTETTDNFASGDLSFSGLEVVLAGTATVANTFKSGTEANASSVTAGNNTVGADATAFSWTWADADDQLADF